MVETSIIFFFGYASYVTCEILHLSGIVGILVTGIFMAHYLIYNLSVNGKASSS